MGSRNVVLKPYTHNLLKNIPWAENVSFLFSLSLLLCQKGTMVPLTGAAGKGVLAERLEVECCSWGGGGGLKFISRSEPALGASFQNKTAVSQSL